VRVPPVKSYPSKYIKKIKKIMRERRILMVVIKTGCKTSEKVHWRESFSPSHYLAFQKFHCIPA